MFFYSQKDKRSVSYIIKRAPLFVKEIENALLEEKVDVAVHSAKDIPAELPDGLEIATFPKREDPRDAWVSNRYRSIERLPAGARVGTGSLRRSAQLKNKRPDLQVIPVRGNVDTRLRKLDSGDFDGILLAAAGLKRLGLSERSSRQAEGLRGLGYLSLITVSGMRISRERSRKAMEQAS